MMDTRMSEEIVNAQADIIGQRLAAGTFDFFEAPRPAMPEDSPAGQLIAMVQFRDPAFLPATAGTIVSLPIESGVCFRSGRVSWGRFFQPDGAPVMDVSVGIENANVILTFVDFELAMEFGSFVMTHTISRGGDGV